MNIIEKLGITPKGKWTVSKWQGDESYTVWNGIIDENKGGGHVANSKNIATADLIAAAPEMLEALIEIVRIIEPPKRDFTGAWIYRATPIIEKATGKTWEQIKEIINE